MQHDSNPELRDAYEASRLSLSKRFTELSELTGELSVDLQRIDAIIAARVAAEGRERLATWFNTMLNDQASINWITREEDEPQQAAPPLGPVHPQDLLHAQRDAWGQLWTKSAHATVENIDAYVQQCARERDPILSLIHI